MRNISVYPISKKEIEKCLEHFLELELESEKVGGTNGVCLQLALQIVKESDFKTYPSVPVELS